MRQDIQKFWEEESLNNIKPATGAEFPEGWDVIEFFKNFRNYGYIIEVGCGYGRLCKAFDPLYYTGIDISKKAINKAKELNPAYDFSHTDGHFPYSQTKLLYTVLLHQADEDIRTIVQNLCNSSKTIIVAEIMGRDWRRPGNPPVFNREPYEYTTLFKRYGKELIEVHKKPYERYKNFKKKDTDLTIMVFE